jgi:hypothetical protein
MAGCLSVFFEYFAIIPPPLIKQGLEAKPNPRDTRKTDAWTSFAMRRWHLHKFKNVQ